MGDPQWIHDVIADCARLFTNTEDAVRFAIGRAVSKCAATADAGRMYAEGDIRSVVSAVRSLMVDDDPWGEESKR